jgi:hypothetical protein
MRMDASPQGMGSLIGWFWNGTECVSHNAQRCNGANCEDAFASREECEAAFLSCLDP